MARKARRVSMYTLMVLLLAAIVVMVILSIISYDRATSADAPCEGCDTCALLKAALDGSEDGSGALCSEWLRAAPTAVRWNDGREVLLFSCKPAEAAGAKR